MSVEPSTANDLSRSSEAYHLAVDSMDEETPISALPLPSPLAQTQGLHAAQVPKRRCRPQSARTFSSELTHSLPAHLTAAISR